MSTSLSTVAPSPSNSLGLRRGALPRWAPVLTVVVALLLTAAAFALTPMQGLGAFVVVAALVYVAVQSAASFGVEGRRRAVDQLATTAVWVSFGLAMIPLAFVLYKVAIEGARLVNLTFLTHSQRNIGPNDTGGGIYHGLIGTLEQAAITSLISIPVAVLVAVYLVEYGRGMFARIVTFFVDVMTGIPSIVAGLFIFTVWVLVLGRHRSGVAAALALAILMIPVVVRSTEEMLKLVPAELREASLALGIPRWRTIVRVVIPTALPGIITGIMLGIARVMGETAPLLLLSGFTSSINFNALKGAQAALPLVIWDQAQRPNDSAVARAWGAALVLIVLVMVLNLLGRAIARRTRVR